LNADPKAPMFFDIRGTTPTNVKAVETTANGSYLNSEHAFVFVVPKAEVVFVWIGSKSNEFEKKHANNVALTYKENRKVIQMEEGKEDASFWTHLGQAQYFQSYKAEPRREPRLFHFSRGSGTVDADEEHLMIQEDLIDHHVMLLDSWYELYLWLGPKSTEIEKIIALETTKEYVIQSKRETINTYIVHPFHEPLVFKGQFQGWSWSKLPKGKSFDLKPWTPTPFDEVMKIYQVQTYSYRELTNPPLPPNVDPSQLEAYLSDEEFVSLFKMSREELRKKPRWKQEEIKRELKLY